MLFSREMLDLQLERKRGRTLPSFVLGQLGLRDAKDLGELDLSQIESPDFANPSAHCSEVGDRYLFRIHRESTILGRSNRCTEELRERKTLTASVGDIFIEFLL